MELGIYAQNYVCEDQGNKDLGEIADSLKYCHDLGFTSLAYLTNIKRDDWEDRAKRLREMLDERGVAIHDAHAPFNRFIRDTDDVYREYLRRSIEAASILGVKQMVFHGEPHITAEDEVYDSKAILEETYDFFAPFVDQAKNAMLASILRMFLRIFLTTRFAVKDIFSLPICMKSLFRS